MIFDVPEIGKIEIRTIILDLNGTLSVNGKVPKGVKEKLKKLRELRELKYKIILFSADQRGTAKKLCKNLNIDFIRTKNSDEKESTILKLNPETCASIGNARIDIGTFKHAKISILTLQSEGIHAETIKYADIIVPSINDALSLLIDKDTFCATMRK